MAISKKGIKKIDFLLTQAFFIQSGAFSLEESADSQEGYIYM